MRSRQTILMIFMINVIAVACDIEEGIEGPDCMTDSDCPRNHVCSDQGRCKSLDRPASPADGVDGDMPDSDYNPPDGDGAEDGDNTEGDNDSDNEADQPPPGDRDNDSRPDEMDNCPDIPNFDQSDRDEDGVGDVCDNCPDNANNRQFDDDGDKRGNACDNCPDTPNPGQSNRDEDFPGDACDNCPYADNEEQEDRDQDGLGDICDPTPEEGPFCIPVDCQPVEFDWLNPCPKFGLECVKDPDAGMLEPGTCTAECLSDDDCPDPFICNNENLCACNDSPVDCRMHECRFDFDCEEFSLDLCDTIPGYTEDVCTSQCSLPDDCEAPYLCLQGRCRCPGGPEPQTCPENECENGDDCRDNGWPEESGCLTPGGYCTIPCENTPFCQNEFGPNWTCFRIPMSGRYCACE